MAHEQVAFNLLEGVQDYAHKDQQRSAAEEAGELVVHTQHIGQCRHTCDHSQENGTREGYLGHNAVQVFGRLLTGLYTGDEATVLLHIFGHHRGIHGNGGVEVCEDDHEQARSEEHTSELQSPP